MLATTLVESWIKTDTPVLSKVTEQSEKLPVSTSNLDYVLVLQVIPFYHFKSQIPVEGAECLRKNLS